MGTSYVVRYTYGVREIYFLWIKTYSLKPTKDPRYNTNPYIARSGVGEGECSDIYTFNVK